MSTLKQATVISYLAFYAGLSPSFKTLDGETPLLNIFIGFL